MSELKPCPFCGGEANIVSDYSSESDKTRWNLWHECESHEGRSAGYGHALRPWFETPWYDTEAEAVSAWNHRAERTCKNVSEHGEFQCSECDQRIFGSKGQTHNADFEYIDINYCPNCGAKVVE